MYLVLKVKEQKFCVIDNNFYTKDLVYLTISVVWNMLEVFQMYRSLILQSFALSIEEMFYSR